MSSLVVVMVGTDHHRFDRLVDWVDEAARRRPDVRFVVQHGASRAPSVAEGHEFLGHQKLLELLAGAAAAVCHGGPGTIMDARSAGHVPLCVPRDPARGEHVDGHQQRFAALAEQAGVVTRISSLEQLESVLDELLAVDDATRPRTLPTSPATEAARARLARELDELVAPRPAGSWWGRWARPSGRPFHG
ncbi:glycosyltransferase [Nocardioides sp. MAHUQ-72]|uniref:glycosyltransferase n=1 Tax=unclassified Nocardioides TaxID=2615069 RepID=UPI0036197D39